MQNFLYKAFISYSHADERLGDWLHRALETYRVPEVLVGQDTAHGPAPRRLTPIFRDRNDLPAAGNLNAEIQAALAKSQFQIVICSPNSAKSRWVNEEIKLFKKLHGPDRTLAVIVAGEPGASLVPGREEEECFPPALRFRIDENGDLTDEPAEPIAADARRDGDGRRHAVTKLAAGLIGVGLDDLVQREASRRSRRARLVAGGSATIAASMALLSVLAINARNDAQHMRGEAENLIEFMLTDLRGKLEPVGRLDALDVVGERALSYYASQDERSLDADALGRRARAMLLVGEIDQRGNDLEEALVAYSEAAAATGELLRREPANTRRIFDHAQSVFYVGNVAAARGELNAAETQFHEYLRLAEQLVAMDPTDPKWRLELAYATSNLGGLKFKAGDYDAAIPYFEQSVAARKAIFLATPDDADVALPFAYALSWQAFAELARGNFDKGIALLREQLGVYEPILNREPDHFRVLDAVVTAQRRLAEAQLSLGDTASAEKSIRKAHDTAERLLNQDLSNANWNLNASHIQRFISDLAGLRGDHEREVEAAENATAFASAVRAVDATNVEAGSALALALARRVEAGGATESNVTALETIYRDLIASNSQTVLEAIGASTLALSATKASAGDQGAALSIRTRGIEALEENKKALTARGRVLLAELYLETNQLDEARALISELDALGFKRPNFLALQRNLQVRMARE